MMKLKQTRSRERKQIIKDLPNCFLLSGKKIDKANSNQEFKTKSSQSEIIFENPNDSPVSYQKLRLTNIDLSNIQGAKVYDGRAQVVITAGNSNSPESLNEYNLSPMKEGMNLTSKHNSQKMFRASLLSTSKVRTTSQYYSKDTQARTTFHKTWKVKGLLKTTVDSPRRNAFSRR